MKITVPLGTAPLVTDSFPKCIFPIAPLAMLPLSIAPSINGVKNIEPEAMFPLTTIPLARLNAPTAAPLASFTVLIDPLAILNDWNAPLLMLSLVILPLRISPLLIALSPNAPLRTPPEAKFTVVIVLLLLIFPLKTALLANLNVDTFPLLTESE